MKMSLRLKTALCTLAMALILAASASIISYQAYSRTMFSDYTTMTVNLSQSIAGLLDREDVEQLRDAVMAVYRGICEENGGVPDLEALSEEEADAYFARYGEIEELPAYQRVLADLEICGTQSGAQSVYLGYTDLATGYCVYLADGSVMAEQSPIGTLDVIEPGELESAMAGDYGFAPHITNYEQYGWLCTVGTGIYNSKGDAVGTLCVDISMDGVVQDRMDFLYKLLAVLALVTAVLVAGIALLINRVIVVPVNALSRAAASFVSNKHEAEQTVSAISELNIHTGDEIEKLSESIQKMELDINQYIDDLTHITAEKERIGAELNVATNIQASMLPSIFPAFPQREEFDIYATMTPAKEVGGDFYDFFLVDDDHLALVIADVSGKGVPAALFMVIAKTLIKNHAQAGTAPEEVFTKVNQQLCESNDEGLFVTAWMGVLELSTGRVTFVNAGHNPPLAALGGKDYEYLQMRHALFLAGLEGTRYQSGTLQLRPGDSLYLYTDGVTEATNAGEELYGEERLKAFLNTRRADTPRDLLPAVKADIDRFVAEAPQYDDITMLTLRYRGTDTGSH